MGELANRPLLMVTGALALGVALGRRWGVPAALAGAVPLGVAAASWLLRCRVSWVGAGALAAAGAAGALLAAARQAPPAGDVAYLAPGGRTLVGTVAGAPRYRDGLWRFVLALEAHEEGGQPQPTAGRVYVVMRSPEPVRRGERWRLTGRLRGVREARNPGGRAEAVRLASLGVSAVMVVGAQELAEPLGPGRLGPIASHAYGAQRRALALLERHVGGPYRETAAAVTAGVIFGVHAAPPPAALVEVFRRAGTIHLLVVSGAMVSMVFGMVFLPGALAAGWRRWREERQAQWPVSGRGRIALRPGLSAALGGMAVVTYYAILTEGGQAVTRAAIMGVLVGLAVALRRVPAVAREHGLNVDRYTLLAAAALGVLVARPAALITPGFQLSFAAVGAILYLSPKMQSLVRWLPKWLAMVLAGTVAAQVATFPILMWHYGEAPVAGFGANLLAIPLAAAVLAAGMLTCILGVAVPWLASAAGWVTGGAARGLVWVSGAFAGLPGASLTVGRPSIWLVIGWYLALLAAGWGLGRWPGGRPEARVAGAEEASA